MSSAECLRELINDRLTAAAEEIFRAVQKTLVEHEKEIDRQRRLLDIVLKPEIKLHRTELPQPHVCKKEEVIADQQLCNQDRNSSLDQDNPKPPQIKEEPEDLCTSLEGQQLVLKQETETFMLAPKCEKSDSSEDQTPVFSPAETQTAAEKEHIVIVSVKSSVEPGPNSDNLLLSHNFHVAESQDCKGGKYGDSGSRDAEPKPKRRRHKSISHVNNEDISTSLKIHSNTYAGKQCLCDTCGKSFKYKSTFHRHLRIHTGEKYPCNNCEKRFSYLATLKEHLRTHTGEKPYTCNTCEKTFSQLGTLKEHMRTHTGEKPYPCKACKKKFSKLGHLKNHMRTHTGEKPYPCKACKKRFSEQGTLKKHMRTHTGEKLYPCNTCKKRFSEKGTLKKHMRTHTGEKPYPCNTCEKRFSKQDTLKRHLRTHTGEKPYQCNTCKRRFSELGSLKRHMRIHTREML